MNCGYVVNVTGSGTYHRSNIFYNLSAGGGKTSCINTNIIGNKITSGNGSGNTINYQLDGAKKSNLMKNYINRIKQILKQKILP